MKQTTFADLLSREIQPQTGHILNQRLRGMRDWTQESLLTLIRHESPFVDSAREELKRRETSKTGTPRA